MKDIFAVLISATAGFLVWALAPTLVGVPLPWDAAWPFYSLMMGMAGLAAAQLSARGWICVGAAWAGQIVALVALPLDRSTNMFGVGAWWVLGVVSTGIGALVLGAGFALGRFVSNWLAGKAARK